MRLTCPNCGAQYEVPDDVIPPEGRDVQCSNCGSTWFQDGPYVDELQAPAPTEEPIAAEPALESEPENVQAAAPEEDPDQDEALEAPVADSDFDAEDDLDPPQEDFATPPPEPESDTADAEEIPVAQPERSGRELDTSVKDILRAEAEREAALRAAEATGVETQPELGLDAATMDDTAHRAQQTRERMARLRGEDPDEPSEDLPGSRRGLLPDIEEINSTLKGNYEVPGPAEALAYDEMAPRQRSGFLRGFTIVILLAVGAALIYQNAGTLATQVPEAAPYLQSYVDWVNETRVWLHTQVEQLAQQPAPAE